LKRPTQYSEAEEESVTMFTYTHTAVTMFTYTHTAVTMFTYTHTAVFRHEKNVYWT